jgi:hypothetical protein
MCTTSGRWVVNLFRSFDFIKAKVKKHLSSSMLPTIYTIANSSSFTYLRKLKDSNWKVVTRHYILVKGFKSKGGAIHAPTFYFIVRLNMFGWQSRSLALNNSLTIISWTSTLWVLPKQKANLITWQCLTTVASHSNCI